MTGTLAHRTRAELGSVCRSEEDLPGLSVRGEQRSVLLIFVSTRFMVCSVGHISNIHANKCTTTSTWSKSNQPATTARRLTNRVSTPTTSSPSPRMTSRAKEADPRCHRGVQANLPPILQRCHKGQVGAEDSAPYATPHQHCRRYDEVPRSI